MAQEFRYYRWGLDCFHGIRGAKIGSIVSGGANGIRHCGIDIFTIAPTLLNIQLKHNQRFFFNID